MKIRSIDRDIADILKGGFYRIPRFQRPYSWDRENTADFWKDVIEDSEGEYFIGSMVTYQPKGSDVSFVVDGQQRLTTIIMILASLRNRFRELNAPDLAAGLQTFIERTDLSNKKQFSLQTETSYPFLQTQIQSDHSEEFEGQLGDEEYALANTFDFFNQKITDELQRVAKANSSEKTRISKSYREACLYKR